MHSCLNEVATQNGVVRGKPGDAMYFDKSDECLSKRVSKSARREDAMELLGIYSIIYIDTRNCATEIIYKHDDEARGGLSSSLSLGYEKR